MFLACRARFAQPVKIYDASAEMRTVSKAHRKGWILPFSRERKPLYKEESR